MPTTAPAPRSTSVNSASGSEVKPCPGCRKAIRDTKTTVDNGLLLIRIRYGIPYTELPSMSVDRLSQYLLFLLAQGKERTSVLFPRRQRMRGKNGLCDLQRLSRRERWALAHSLNSIKRNLPQGCRRHTPTSVASWKASALSTPPHLLLSTSPS